MEDIIKLSQRRVEEIVEDNFFACGAEDFGEGYVDVRLEFDIKMLEELGIQDEAARSGLSIIESDVDFFWFWAISKTSWHKRRKKTHLGRYWISDSESACPMKEYSKKLDKAIRKVCIKRIKEEYAEYVEYVNC